jgi:hypothetical protein
MADNPWYSGIGLDDGGDWSNLMGSGQGSSTSSPLGSADYSGLNSFFSDFVDGPSSGGPAPAGPNYAGIASALAPLIASAFGPSNPYPGKISGIAGGLPNIGSSTMAAGQGALAPVLTYLQQLVGGSGSSALAATAPQRSRVIDQFDAARKTLANFTPRGGGQVSGTENLESNEASTLANTTSAARTSAVGELGQLGAGLTSTGLNANLQGSQAALNAFGGLNTQQQQSNQQLGSAIGSVLPMMLMAFGMSSETLKERMEPLKTDDFNTKLAKLRLKTWHYKGDPVKHMGPTAEDFTRVFGVGDGKTLHLVDVMGVLLASQQAFVAKREGRRA